MAVSIFGDVVGHQRVLQLLGGEAARPAQAYLFVGPGSVGKATVARRFAASLLCPALGSHEGSCPHCRRVIEGSHPDVEVIEPDGKTVLTVEQARRAVAAATLTPVEAARKIFLIEEAGSMNDEAANALLKTLEEPTASTVFVLVAEAEDELPPTVASRCRVIHFGRVGEEEVAQALVGLGVGAEQAEEAARIAGGRPGLAMALATRPEVAEFRRAWLAVPSQVTPRPGEAIRLADRVLQAAEPLLAALRERQVAELEGLPGETPAAHERLLKDRHDRELRRASQALFVTGLEILASWYRDAAAAQFGAPVRNRDVPGTALATVPPAAAVARVERVLEAVEGLRGNQRPPLVLAALFADLGAVD
ncbi:MAG: DNA polymerase III subunit delta' [Actinomycetota bacterium]|nr:DNA polymerase III subunit delta' [Actinomycetota bacterium]